MPDSASRDVKNVPRMHKNAKSSPDSNFFPAVHLKITTNLVFRFCHKSSVAP